MKFKLAVVAVAVLSMSVSSVKAVEDGTTAALYTSDARLARIASLKAEYRISLDDTEKSLVSSRCSSAQDGLKKIDSRLSLVGEERASVYAETVDSLLLLKTLLINKQVDTSGIDMLTVSYQQHASLFKDAVTHYKLTLEDSVQIDCKNNPEDFRAALEGVRAARKQVVDASSQLHELSRSNLKTTFDSIRLKLSTGVDNGK